MREKSLLVLTGQFQGVEDEVIGGSVRVVQIPDTTRNDGARQKRPSSVSLK